MAWAWCHRCGSMERPIRRVSVELKVEMGGRVQAEVKSSTTLKPKKRTQRAEYICADCGSKVEYDGND